MFGTRSWFVLWYRFFFIGTIFISTCLGQQYDGACDKPRNANLPFCDSTLSLDARVQDLISRLSLDEKIGLLVQNAHGASEMIDLDEYDWWGEALHGVADAGGVYFRPPTEFATVFPQILNLAASFNKDLFFRVGNATGNEARAFYNVGNGVLTYWSPNINIYRDPRWGRGHETPGEDPHLNAEYGRMFVTGMQGNEEREGFLKTSACCKHYAAHSMDDGRLSFNAVVTERDLADTYLPAFKSCVQEANASCVMCSYNAVNGVPACANKRLLTEILREQWGFDGYIVSDMEATGFVYSQHHYTDSPAETARAVLDAGMDLENWASRWSGTSIFLQNLRQAVQDGLVSEQNVNTALFRAYRVMMRLGYFEKDATRPYKDLVPGIVDSASHQTLALEAARQSIVLLKNAPNAKSGETPLPFRIDQNRFRVRDRTNTKHVRASMALIGPHLNSSNSFLGNYNGIPSFISTPLAEIQKYIPDLEYETGCELASLDNSRLQQAEDLARTSGQVVLFVGLDTHCCEDESRDRANLILPGLQNELIRRVLAAAQEPVIMFLVSGGSVDIAEWKDDPRVGAIIWAGYLGQSAGEAMADVLFGVYNPSGRLPQTFYSNSIIDKVAFDDMNMRPGVNGSGSPGRTYRFYTEQPVYPFGYGLSYTSFEYILQDAAVDECAVQFTLTVRNTGQRTGDHSVLWFLAPPAAGQMGRPIKSLLDFERVNGVLPLESRVLELCLSRGSFELANEQGEFEVVAGEWTLSVGELRQSILVL